MDNGTSHMVAIPLGGPVLLGEFALPPDPKGVVVVADGSGSGRERPEYRVVADRLADRGLGTLVVDLLTEREGSDLANRFDVALLTDRLLAVTAWLRGRRVGGDLPVSYVGANTGSAAAVRAATAGNNEVGAVVALGGRIDLAGDALDRQGVPTLVVLGATDRRLEALVRDPFDRIPAKKALRTVADAGHAFDRVDQLEAVAASVADWILDATGGGAVAGPGVDADERRSQDRATGPTPRSTGVGTDPASDRHDARGESTGPR